MAYDKQSTAATTLDNLTMGDAAGKVYVNLAAFASTVPGFNNFSDATTLGTLSSNLTDEYGQASGLSLTLNAAFTGSSGSDATAVSGHYGFPEAFFDFYWYDSADAGSLTISATNGELFTVKIAGHTTQAARDTNFSASNAASNPYLYDSSGTTTPTAPVTMTGTVGGGGITLTHALVSSFAYNSGFSIELVSAAKTITLSGNAWLQKQNIPLTTSASALLQKAFEVNAAMGAYLQGGSLLTAEANALLQKALAVDTQLGAYLQSGQLIVSDMSAYVQKAQSIQTSVGAWLTLEAAASTLSLTLGAFLQKLNLTQTVSLNADLIFQSHVWYPDIEADSSWATDEVFTSNWVFDNEI